MNRIQKILSSIADNIQNTVIELFPKGSNIRLTGIGKGIDPDDVATMRNIIETNYEEILLADFQTASAAGTLVAGRSYAITDLIVGWKAVFNAYSNATNNGIANGILFVDGYDNPTTIFDIQLNIISGTIVSYHNRYVNVMFNSDAMFTALTSGALGNRFFGGSIRECNFNSYTGTITVDASNYTTLLGCDFSNSAANFDTSELTGTATFSGRILHDFAIPDQTLYPCDFTNTIQINADGTNNMMATITLAAAQSTLDYTGFESAGIVKLVPDAGGNGIDTINNVVVGREYKIVSDDTAGLLEVTTGVNIILDRIIDSVMGGSITWFGTHVDDQVICFKLDPSAFILITSNSQIYL